MFLAGLIHFYWALGGRKFADAVLPERADGGKLFRPSAVGTITVGAVLCAVAFSCVLPIFVGGLQFFWIRTVFAVIFFARFVGEFRYVGLFKKYRQSDFAKYDTLIYSPLSLLFSFSCFLSVLYF